MSLKQVRDALKGKNYSAIARKVGVSQAYISYIANGQKTNPTYSVMEKLSEVLKENPA